MLFILAWAAIAFAIVRALVTAWGLQPRLAAATAVAVAGAFALGAISPFALPSRGVVIEQSAAPPVPVADTSHSVTCPAGVTVANATAPGHLDSVSVGGAAPGVPGAVIEVPAGTPIRLDGWIVLPAGPPAMICALVDGRPAASTTRYGATRSDVAVALGKPADAPSGFVVTLSVPAGLHSVSVGAVEPDGRTIDAMQGGGLHVDVR